MDHTAASEGPGPCRRPPGPSPGTHTCAQGQAAHGGQRPRVKITPFHSSPIVSGDGALRSKRPGAASGRPLASSGSLFRDTPGRLTAPPVRNRPAAAAAGSSADHPPTSGSVPATTGAKAQPCPLVVKVNGIYGKYSESV